MIGRYGTKVKWAFIVGMSWWFVVSTPVSGQGLDSPSASPASSPRPLVVFIVDRLAFEDFTDFPEATAPFIRTFGSGYTGMMNVRTTGTAHSRNGYLSLAAGVRAADPQALGALIYIADETFQGQNAADHYAGANGHSPSAGAFHLYPHAFHQLFPVGTTPPGTLFNEWGLDVTVLGNGDTIQEKHRYGAFFAMDGQGLIHHGNVGKDANRYDPTFPGGWRTDTQKLTEQTVDALKSGLFDVVVVDWADLARLEVQASSLSPPRQTQLREHVLNEIGTAIETVLTHPSATDAHAIFVVPSPSTAAGRPGIALTPAWWRPPGASSGFLTSASTRRTGIVTNTDFMPSILHLLTTEHAGGLSSTTAPFTTATTAGGQPWFAVPATDAPLSDADTPLRNQAFSDLVTRYEKIKAVHIQRLPVLQPYFYVVITVLLVGALYSARRVFPQHLSFFPFRAEKQNHRWLDVTWTTVMAFPGALLIVGQLPSSASPVVTGVTAAAIAGGVAGAGTLISRWIGTPPIAGVAALTATVLIADVITGSRFMQHSLLGYDPVGGSRFYGIGNEYAGVLIGSALVTAGTVADRFPGTLRYATSVTAIAVAAVMMHPRYGINVGCAMASLIAGTTAVLFPPHSTGGFSFKKAVQYTLIGAGSVLLMLAAAAAYDQRNVALPPVAPPSFSDDMSVTMETDELTEPVHAVEPIHVQPTSSSHFGRFVHHVYAGDDDVLWSTFSRKIATNIKLTRLTVWSRVLFLAWFVLALFMFLPNRQTDTMKRRNPGTFHACRISIIGGVAAFALNDSGVVAAATLTIWPAFTLMSLLLNSESAGP